MPEGNRATTPSHDDRYERARACEIIGSHVAWVMGRQVEESEFDEAKAEAIKVIDHDIMVTQAMTADEYHATTKATHDDKDDLSAIPAPSKLLFNLLQRLGDSIITCPGESAQCEPAFIRAKTSFLNDRRHILKVIKDLPFSDFLVKASGGKAQPRQFWMDASAAAGIGRPRHDNGPTEE